MEDQLERKFVCKWCNKRYPCGKSLGGHIRCHNIVVDSSEKNGSHKVSSSSSSLIESQFELINGNSSYGLRENPRKTFKAVDAIASFPLSQEKVCKQCGKVFQSLKALCGHMACHSEKDKGLKDDHSWTSENQNLVIDDDDDDGDDDNQSDTESEDRFQWNKAKSYKKLTIKSSSSSLLLASTNNGSPSSGSDIDEQQDQEEIALSLMMLSKDSSNWGGVNSIVESSDNHSVILETKSSSIDTKFVLKKDVPTPPQTKKVARSEENSENSDSGYYLDEFQKGDESDTSVDGFLSKKYKNKKHNYVSERVIKKVRHGSFDLDEKSKVDQKRRKYECMNCKKTFNTYQGLGGHRPCNKKINHSYERWYETGENSVEDEDTDDPDENNKKSYSKKKGVMAKDSKSYKVEKKISFKTKNKIHECPYCSRIFKNGQALGGHKRSHFLGGGGAALKENKNHPPPPVSSKSDQQPELLDLNLPAPLEDDVDEQFVSR